MSRTIWLGTNWKMTKTTSEGIEFVKRLEEIVGRVSPTIQAFVIPSYTSLHPIRQALGSSRLLLGAQNMHWEDRGPYTGEISPLMLKEIPVDIVELGHSERRAYYGENDADLNKKIHSALWHGFRPLLCIGENIREKQNGISREVLAQQLKVCLKDVTPEQAGQLIVAYEPVWAIGEKGVPASAEYVSDIHAFIRSVLQQLFPEYDIPILYGGSVNHDNFMDYLRIPDVNGLFIGRAAWNIDGFEALLDEVNRLLAEE